MKNMRTLALAGLLAVSGVAFAGEPVVGYLTDKDGNVVKNSTGLCWRTGSWSAQTAVPECEGVVAKQEENTMSKVDEPRPMVAEPHYADVVETSRVGFGFGIHRLDAKAIATLDAMIGAMDQRAVGSRSFTIVGHADRIGSEKYNMALSLRRAMSVKAHLESRGVPGTAVTLVGAGEAESLTGEDCKGLGREVRSNAKLVSCLAPDRRADVEAKGVVLH